MVGPEQPFLGSLYTPAEALDPSAFMGLESGTEFLPGKAGEERSFSLTGWVWRASSWKIPV